MSSLLLVKIDKLVEPAVLLVAIVITDNGVDSVPAFVESALAIDEPGVDLARVCHPADATSVAAGIERLFPAAHICGMMNKTMYCRKVGRVGGKEYIYLKLKLGGG